VEPDADFREQAFAGNNQVMPTDYRNLFNGIRHISIIPEAALEKISFFPAISGLLPIVFTGISGILLPDLTIIQIFLLLPIFMPTPASIQWNYLSGITTTGQILPGR